MGNDAIRLDGKVAIVTGASRGVGQAIASRFASQGAKVVLAARKIEGLESAAASIRSTGGEAIAVACHIGKPDQIEALVARAVAELGQVDILVNNAATNPYFGPLMGVESAAWDKTFQVNLKGYFETTRAVVEHLRSRGAKGSIVNVASILGLQSAPFQGVYGMTKAAIISMTKTLAVELASLGIRVNAIAPGILDTRFSQALVDNDQIREPLVAQTPQKRLGRPTDISGAALFLASNASDFVTGETIVIDGGLTLGVSI